MIDYQEQYYYAKPKSMAEKPKSLDDVDPKVLETYAKLGIPLKEQMVLAGVENAADHRRGPQGGRRCGVRQSVSVGTTFQKDELAEGWRYILLDLRSGGEVSRTGEEIPWLASSRRMTTTLPRSIRRCVQRWQLRLHPRRCEVPDGTEHLFPHQRRKHRPVRAHADRRRKARRRSATWKAAPRPSATTHQLHAAVVEIVALEDAVVKYSTVQNWFPGDEEGKGGIFNFVTKRADCREGPRAR